MVESARPARWEAAKDSKQDAAARKKLAEKMSVPGPEMFKGGVLKKSEMGGVSGLGKCKGIIS